MSTDQRLRVAIYGCGNFAKRTRIPNLLQTDAVDIVAVCDSNLQAAQEIAAEFKVPHVYHTENDGASGSFNCRFFVLSFSQVLTFLYKQKSRDFSRDFCYTSP